MGVRQLYPVVSEIVLDEIGRGYEGQAQKRIALVADLDVLIATDEAVYLANLLVARKALPKKAYVDALHIAITTVHHIPVIASYNFRHIAGAFSRRLIEQTLQQLGYTSPVIANPEELIGV